MLSSSRPVSVSRARERSASPHPPSPPQMSSSRLPFPPPTSPVLRSPPSTLRSLTGSDVYPPAPTFPKLPSLVERRYSRQRIYVFRAASGEERPLSPTDSDAKSTRSDVSANSSAPDSNMPLLEGKPRISSVTESVSTSSPDHTQATLSFTVEPPSLQPQASKDRDSISRSPVDDDTESTYSHASAVNLDDLDDEDLAGLRAQGLQDVDAEPLAVKRQMLEYRRQSFANSFAKARKVVDERKAMVLSRPELQPQNKSVTLIERCVQAFMEILDLNVSNGKATVDRFHHFSALYTKDERMIIGELLIEGIARLRSQNTKPAPWRSTSHWAAKMQGQRNGGGQASQALVPQKKLSTVVRGPWARRGTRHMSNETLVRSVVFGSHVIPGVQSAESILMRMAGEYQREEVNRKASRAERIDIPLSFAMTLTGAISTFVRLDCNVTYRRYRSRSAANRRSIPQAMLVLKTKYDGLKLSFAVTLHGESPCTVLFRRPRIFSPRKIDDYATLVTEAKEILSEYGKEVAGPRD